MMKHFNPFFDIKINNRKIISLKELQLRRDKIVFNKIYVYIKNLIWISSLLVEKLNSIKFNKQ